MVFLSPYFLLGMLGIAVPIAIHLLNRFRPKELDWAAMELLRRALAMRSRQIRIEDLILLILRCLAIILLALALARPTVTPSGAKWLGGQSYAGVVLAIDGSYSMDHRPAAVSRFEQSLNQAKEIFHTLEPGNPVTLVLMGSRPHILLRNVGYEPSRFAKLLDELAPTAETLNLEQNLDELRPLLSEMKAPIRECYLLTDGQTITWQNLSGKAQDCLRGLGNLGRLYCVASGAESGENLAITRFELQSGVLRKNTMALYAIDVRNFGKQPQPNVTVSLEIDGVPVDQRMLESVPPGVTTPVSLYARFDKDKVGPVRLVARIGQDALTLDNARYCVANIDDQVKVLLVNGRPSDEAFKGATDFLRVALAPKNRPDRPDPQVTSVPWLELANQRLSDYDVVIMADVSDVSKEQAAGLADYVTNGGNLIVFPGANVDGEMANLRFRGEKVSLLPGTMGKLLGQATEEDKKNETGWTIAPSESKHPLGVISKLRKELLAEARVYRLYQVQPDANATVILRLAGSDEPLLLEKSVGRGKVLLCTTTADCEWSDIPRHPIFPLLMHQAVTYMTRRPFERSGLVGETLVLPLADPTEASVTFRDPRGKDNVVQAAPRDGQLTAELPDPEQVGFYSVRQGKSPQTTFVAINPNTVESDVAALAPIELQASLKNLPVRLLDGGQLSGDIRNSRIGREFWQWALGLALAVFVLESLLAWYFSRRIARANSLQAVREELLSPRRHDAV